MKLYYSPLACSLATRIALYEANLDAAFVEVDPYTKRLPDGSDYRDVYALGLVPALRLEDDTLLTENAAVLLYIAERTAGSGASATDTKRLELQRWLSFVGTELHKGLFATLFDAKAPEEAKRYVIEKGHSRLAFIDRHMEGRNFVLDDVSVVDAYLYTVLNWTFATPVELQAYPALKAFHGRMYKRPSVSRAFTEERELYAAEQARRNQ